MAPDLILHPFNRADGSVSFSTPLFTIIAAANGPVEVQRRDELPEEAAIEVNIRPIAGIGGPRERWLESVVTSLLKTTLLVHMHPRTLMQVTLQVTKEPTQGGLKRAIADLAIIPALVNAAFLSVVDAGLPLRRSVVAALAVVGADGKVRVDPTEKELGSCRSVHALAFSREGEMLLAESAGSFEMDEWELVEVKVREVTTGAVARVDGDDNMEGGIMETEPWLREKLEENVREAGAWREKG